MCVIGADKWHQLHDLGFYDGSEAARDAALARLPDRSRWRHVTA